jgi:hypothetical protein
VEHLAFGSFNPRFYGISIILSEHDRMDAMGRYEQAPSVALWENDGGTLPLTEILTLSAGDHEARHFHDFLLSPLGTMTMGLRMQASINGVQVMKALTRCYGEYVPVPLSRWVQWDDTERQGWIDSTGKFVGIENLEAIVKLPSVADVTRVGVQAGAYQTDDALTPEQDLEAFVLPAAQAYASMEELRQRKEEIGDMTVSAVSVFEATAHLVQMQSVWTGQGEAAAMTFYEFILRSPSEYLLPLQVLWTAVDRGSQKVSIRRMTELFTWMLLGSWDRLASGVHPAQRYFQVLTLAAASSEQDVFAVPMSSARVFDRLDELTSSPSWRDSIKSASLAADRRSEFYSRVSDTLNGGYFDALFSVARAWYEDQRVARTAFLNDPESLVDPLRYVTECVYPLPFIETRLGSMVHHRSGPLISPNLRAIAVDADGKRVISYIGRGDSLRTGDCLDDIVNSRLATHLVDFLFLDEPTLDGYDSYWRSRTESFIKKKIVSVY